MKTTVRVEGLKQVEEAFADLGKSISRRVASKALREGGEVLARAAREKVPKKDLHLMESIDVGTRLTRRQATLHQKQDPVEMFVGPNDPAAVPQEFGTFKAPPQPYMRPAWQETKARVLKRASDVLMVEVEAAARRQAAKAARLARGK